MVHLKEGLADPQGKTLEDALPTMGYTNVSDVRVGKVVHLTVEAETKEHAQGQVKEIAERLLTNPVIESFWIVDVEEGE
ncbi:MAG: phosphoribosylformylglycinamidine synthase subunit PurS [Actinomycetota bacterium]